MSESSLDKRRKALEEDYFVKKNQEALARLKEKAQEDKRPVSPIDGSELEDFVINGLVVGKCKASEGLWIALGELKQLVEQCDQAPDSGLGTKLVEDLNSQVAKEAGSGESSRLREEVRKSPITGKDMEKVMILGELVDKCVDTGGVWLDAGELESLLKREREEDASSDSFIASFFRGLVG